MDLSTYASHRARNIAQSVLIIVALSALLAWLGHLIAGSTGVTFALMAAAGLVIAMTVTPLGTTLRLLGARPLSPAWSPELFALVAELARRAGLDAPPRLYLSDGAIPNAAAVGTRDNAAIVVTRGLFAHLTPNEVAAVLAHEMAHVRHNDIWTMQLAGAFAQLTALLSTFGQLIVLISIPFWIVGAVPLPLATLAILLLAPVVGTLLQLALSRTREYDADATAARLIGSPRPLMSALAKLDALTRGWPWRLLPQMRGNWLNTHPGTRERLARLAELAPLAPPARPRTPAHFRLP